MSLRIAFDLDGVLADMESALLREAAALFGPSATAAAPPTERPPNEPQDKSTSADADLPEAIRSRSARDEASVDATAGSPIVAPSGNARELLGVAR